MLVKNHFDEMVKFLNEKIFNRNIKLECVCNLETSGTRETSILLDSDTKYAIYASDNLSGAIRGESSSNTD